MASGIEQVVKTNRETLALDGSPAKFNNRLPVRHGRFKNCMGLVLSVAKNGES